MKPVGDRGIHVYLSRKKFSEGERVLVVSRDNGKRFFIESGDWKSLRDIMESDEIRCVDGAFLPLQVFGPPGIGKTLTSQLLIHNTMDEYTFTVIDPNNEYGVFQNVENGGAETTLLPAETVVLSNPTNSYRIYSSLHDMLVENVFELGLSTIIPQIKENENYGNPSRNIVIIDEFHRFSGIGRDLASLVLREARKYYRLVVITNKLIASEGFPIVEIINTKEVKHENKKIK